MEHFWPGIGSTSNHYQWRHEWEKHGVCSPFQTELEYFSTGLQVRERVNIDEYVYMWQFKPVHAVICLLNSPCFTASYMNTYIEGQSGQKEHLLISINDLLILINHFLILKRHFVILINMY